MFDYDGNPILLSTEKDFLNVNSLAPSEVLYTFFDFLNT